MNALEARATQASEPGAYSFHRTPRPTQGRSSRLGVIDLGSNTFHLTIADVGPRGRRA